MAHKSKTEDVIRCSFCGRKSDQVQSIIAGPDVYICDACVAFAEDVLRDGVRSGALTPAKPGRRTRCSFCGKRGGPERRLATGPAASVCGECARVCRQILEDRVP